MIIDLEKSLLTWKHRFYSGPNSHVSKVILVSKSIIVFPSYVFKLIFFISFSQRKDEFDQLNLYCYCLFGINGFVLFLCSLVISSRMLNHKTCYLLLMICTFLTAIVFLVILGLTVGISFTKG